MRKQVKPWVGVVVMVPLIASCSEAPKPGPAAPASSAVPVSQPGLVSVTGKAPQGAVVALESTVSSNEAPPPAPVVMDQRGQQFLPPLLVARVGQPIEFRNGEGIAHNVNVTRNVGGTVEFNVSTDPGQAYTHTFATTGTYEVACDIHPSMRASLAIVNTPHAAMAGDFGSFVIMNVPPGTYELVTLYGNETTRRTVELSGTHTDVDRKVQGSGASD
jgi:plastocyanin